jgi:hypothetical protein
MRTAQEIMLPHLELLFRMRGSVRGRPGNWPSYRDALMGSDPGLFVSVAAKMSEHTGQSWAYSTSLIYIYTSLNLIFLYEKAEPLAQGGFRLSADQAFSPSTVSNRMNVHKPIASSRSLEHPGGFAEVNSQAIVQAGDSFFWGLTKKTLIDVILSLREDYTKAQAQIIKLKEENAKLKEKRKQQKINAVNSAAN